MMKPAILIIGGGVAGSACAIRLNQLGIGAKLVEQCTMPRAKVCGGCLGGAGLSLLNQLGLSRWIKAHGHPLKRWHASIDGHLAELPLPNGVAVDRRLLDTAMIEFASQGGTAVALQTKATVKRNDRHQVDVMLCDENETIHQSFDAVVLAAGLNAGAALKIAGNDSQSDKRESPDARLGWQRPPHGPFGVAFTATCRDLPKHTIHMVCDRDGYVGLVHLDDHTVDVAAALTSGAMAAKGATPMERIEQMLRRSPFPDWQFTNRSPVMTTAKLRRHRLAGWGRLIAIGDAAGYVEPFTGEGMTWAMRTGIEAANLIGQMAGHPDPDWTELGPQWNRTYPSLTRSGQWPCRIVTSALHWSVSRYWLGKTLRRWPKLANPLLHRLDAG